MAGNTHLVLVLAAAALLPLAAAHGYLQWPESRNYQAYLASSQTQFYCPQCGQGNGSPPSMCGDPFQGYDSPFQPFTQRFFRYTNLTQGQTFTALITVTANHGGRMSMAICPLPRGQATQDCFNRPENQLRRVNANPLYNNKRYWYLTAGASQFQETFKLPDGVSCENGCMLQWWWVGFQSCVMPCEDTTKDDIAGECGKNLVVNNNVGVCASPANAEQFYNCADVIIKSSGGTVRPSPPPSPAAKASPPPSPSTAKPSPPPSPATAKPPPPPGSSSCPIADQTAYCRILGAGLFPDPCSCNQFFNCGPGGAGGRQSCPSGLLFNKATKQCDWPANVVC